MKNNNIDPYDEDPMSKYIRPSSELPEDIAKEVFGHNSEEEFGIEEECPFMDAIIDAISFPRPFGIVWSDEKLAKFLEGRGYKIIEKHYKDPSRKKDTYRVALKPGIPIPPEEESNFDYVFSQEVQDILLNWLNKIG